MIKISGALMALANIAITIAMLAAIAAHVRSASAQREGANGNGRL